MLDLAQGQWSTDDLILAVWLAYRECSYVTTVDGSNCHWVFVDGEALQRAVDEYDEKRAAADPASLINTYIRMRREMFSKLDAAKSA